MSLQQAQREIDAREFAEWLAWYLIEYEDMPDYKTGKPSRKARTPEQQKQMICMAMGVPGDIWDRLRGGDSGKGHS